MWLCVSQVMFSYTHAGAVLEGGYNEPRLCVVLLIAYGKSKSDPRKTKVDITVFIKTYKFLKTFY